MGTSQPVTVALAFTLGATFMLLYVHRKVIFRRHGRSQVVGVLPARYKSSRFMGKPLAKIMGKTMIQRTWEQAKKATMLDAVVVATDDEGIAAECRRIGADVVMTSEECPNGTVRCYEAICKLRERYDLVVNIQGDEPLVDPEIIDGVVKTLQASPDAMYSTAVTPLKHEEAVDPNRVKCVVDQKGYAIYFSRGLIPFNKSGKVDPEYQYALHLGLQCYDAGFLALYQAMPPTPLQLQEDLEQLKVIENGYKMKVIMVDHDAHGVDSPSDIASIEAIMRKRGIT